MSQTKPFWIGMLASFFALLVAAELFCSFAAKTGFWYRHFDISGDMTSLAEIRDRLHYLSLRPHPVVLFGDSVLGASSLMEHRVPGARAFSLSRLLEGKDKPSGFSCLSLASDGLLLADIEALTSEIEKKPPEKILLLLNFRMFAKDFTSGPDALSRKFLLGDLSPEFRSRIGEKSKSTPESRLSDRLYAWMCDHSAFFRGSQMLKILWYYPSQKDFYQKLLEKIVGSPEGLEDIREAALKIKVASFYRPDPWNVSDLPYACLKRALSRWEKMGVRVYVVLTPQNAEFLGERFDKGGFEANRKALAAFFKANASGNVSYRDWSQKYPSTLFLDHCHLTSEGNARYAGELVKVLEE
jgi:hypothetical protein